MDFYPSLKLGHIFLASWRSAPTYGIWQARAAREPQHLGWALKGVKFLDDRVANPSHIGLGIIGRLYGAILAVLVVVIIVLMVIKPGT